MAKCIIKVPFPVENKPLGAKLLGQFLRAKRTQGGLTIEEAASLCEIAKATYNKLERGEGNISFASVLKSCQMMGLVLGIEVK